MSLKVKKMTVFAPKKLAGGEPDNDRIEYRKKADQGPIMRNAAIEAHDERKILQTNTGRICLAVMPGKDRIGDIAIHIQYEGPNGAAEECMKGHNDLLCRTSGFIHELFKKEDVVWEVSIESNPCPSSDIPVELLPAMEMLETGKVTTPMQVPTNQTTVKNAVEQQQTINNMEPSK